MAALKVTPISGDMAIKLVLSAVALLATYILIKKAAAAVQDAPGALADAAVNGVKNIGTGASDWVNNTGEAITAWRDRVLGIDQQVQAFGITDPNQPW